MLEVMLTGRRHASEVSLLWESDGKLNPEQFVNSRVEILGKDLRNVAVLESVQSRFYTRLLGFTRLYNFVKK